MAVQKKAWTVNFPNSPSLPKSPNLFQKMSSPQDLVKKTLHASHSSSIPSSKYSIPRTSRCITKSRGKQLSVGKTTDNKR